MRLPALSLLLLVACGETFAEPAMKPGLWEVTTLTESAPASAPANLTPAQRKQMAAGGVRTPGPASSGKPTTMRHCVAPGQATPEPAGKAAADARSRCAHKNVKTTGDTVSWKIECSGEYRMSGSGSITYRGNESYRGETAANVVDARGNATSVKQTIAGKWLAAACK